VLGTLMPERDAQYRANEAQIDYSRVYMAGHYPGDVAQERFLATSSATTFITRTGVEPVQVR